MSRVEARSHHDIDPTWGEKAAVSRSGDLWILDTHKLLCGDARSADDLKLVMGADRVDMAFIDLGDGKRADDAEDGVRRVLDAAAAVSREGAVHFVCTTWAGVSDLAATAKEAGRRLLDVVVWVTPEPSQGAMYRDQYEPIGVLEIGSSERLRPTQKRRARRARSNVRRYPSATSLPSTFPAALRSSARLVPVALVADAIKDCTGSQRDPRSVLRRRGHHGGAAANPARVAPNGNRDSSMSRFGCGRQRRVGMRSTRRAACRSMQSRRRRSRKHDGWER